MLRNTEAAGVNQAGCRLAGFFLFGKTDVGVHVSEAKHSGIGQDLLWDTGRNFPNQVLNLSVWLGFRSEKQT